MNAEQQAMELPSPPGRGRTLLSVRNLRVRFGSKDVVHGVSFDLAAGEKLALVGESGSGKTITALSLLRLAGDAQLGGQALFDGRDLLRLPEREMRAVHALQAVTLPVDHWDHRISELSGGQMQRVAIARALVNDPPIILADEPTGNLDSTTGALVMETFHKLQKRGKTIVLITHDPGIAAEADRAVTIRDGRIHDGAYVAHTPNTLRGAVNNLPAISATTNQPKGAKA